MAESKSESKSGRTSDNCPLTIWWNCVELHGIAWQKSRSCETFAELRNFRSRANSNLAADRPGWQSSLAMFCGLATKLAHSLAPKHAVSAVPASEPEAAMHMHAKLAGRPIHHKATLGLMGFAGSCSGLLRVPTDNASRRERTTTANRCGTCGFAQPALGCLDFCEIGVISFPVTLQGATSQWRFTDVIVGFQCCGHCECRTGSHVLV